MNKRDIMILGLIICFVFSLQAVAASDLNATDDVISIDNDVSAYSLPDTDAQTLGSDAESFSRLASDINRAGVVTLTKNYTYAGDTAYQDGIVIPQEVTKIVAEGNVVIDGNGQARIFKVESGRSVILEGITFANGHSQTDGGSILSSGSLTVNSCKFINSTAAGNGGAVYTSGSGSTMSNSIFHNNSAAGNGGAVAWSGNEGGIDYCNFTDNRAVNMGGAVYLEENENITISHSRFENNFANISGGAICWRNQVINGKLYHSILINNIAKGSGGGLYWDGQNGTVYNVTFIASKAIGIVSSYSVPGVNFDGRGGAVFWSGPYGNITNTRFTANVAGDDGGAINWEGSNGTMYNITCISNVGISQEYKNTTSGKDEKHNSKGGTICLTGSDTTIDKSSFAQTSAVVDGGAIYVTGNNVNITNSQFDRCNVSKDLASTTKTIYGGGSVFVIGNYTNIVNCTFSRTSACKGGVVYVQGHDVTIGNATVKYAIATKYGGSFYIAGDNVTLSDSHISYSNATASGGAIYIEGENAVINGSTFDINYAFGSASNGGGSIFIKGNNATIEKSNFTRNFANNNTQALGGAIYITGSWTTVLDSRFENTNANLYGGAIYISGAGTTNTTIKNSNFTKTTVDANNAHGGAIYVNGENTTIMGSKFNLCTASATKLGQGGAIYLNGNFAKINGSAFDSNTANKAGAVYIRGSNATIDNSSFTENIARGGGGAILSYGIGSKVFNSNFTSNEGGLGETADGGGAISWFGGSKSDTIENCTFIANKAGFGGVIRWNYYSEDASGLIKNCTFINNWGVKGGTISWAASDSGKIDLCRFINNTASKNGGAIYAGTGGSGQNSKGFTISNSTFKNNTATFNGGAIASSMKNGIIFNCTFTDDSAGYGGAIVLRESSPVGSKVLNCTFTNTHTFASIDGNNHGGGAIYIANYANIQVINNTFTNCYSNTDGGTIKWLGANGQFINNTITGTNCTGYAVLSNGRIVTEGNGGAILWTGTNGYMKNISIEKSYSDKQGGAIYWNSENVKIENITITEAHSGGEGGAIYWYSSRGTLENVAITDSWTEKDGGAIYWNGNRGKVSNMTFQNNDAKSGSGGAVYWAGSNGEFSNSDMSGSDAIYGGAVFWLKDTGKIFDLNFTSNTASFGGVIYSVGDDVKIESSNFTSNTASYDGGAIYATGKSTSITECNFTFNNAGNGGAIYTDSGDSNDEQTHPIIISSSSFTSNKATSEGGAIYSGYIASQILLSNFTNNTAGINGGAIVISSTSQKIANCSFLKNNATAKGGSVYIKKVSDVRISDSTFKQSFAYDGGAVYNVGSSGASLTIYNDTFIKNIASHNGGAVYYVVDNDGDKIPIVYRDYYNGTFDGRGTKDANGRTTVASMVTSTATYDNRIFSSYFEGNEDYLLNVSAIPDNDTTMGIVNIYDPRDPDKNSVKIVINLTNASGLVRNLTITSSNFYSYYNNDTHSFGINFGNLTKNEFYNVTVTFGDAYYLNKTVKTNFTVKNIEPKGDFQIIQGMIHKAIEDRTFVVDLKRNYEFTLGLDKGCMNITNVTEPLTIRGHGWIISALGYCRIFNITSDNVTLDNIVFRDGNASGEYHDNNTVNGGAIFWAGANGNLSNSVFRQNNATVGGALYLNASAANCIIHGCSFYENNATQNGGAIDCNASSMNLTETLFESNYAGIYGAALCREINATGGFGVNNTFISNTAGIAGAALAWINASQIKITNYTFTDNTVGVSGGAIYVGPGSINCTIITSNFTGNKVVNDTGGHGGAIEWYASTGSVINSTFTSNEAFYGGAIFVGATSDNITIYNSNFTYNKAYDDGGAINLEASSVNVTDSHFLNNTAENCGGAIYAGGHGETNYIRSSVFEGNMAKNSHGGAIEWVASTGYIYDSNFTSNSAQYGGGIYFGLESKDSRVENVIFKNNTATINGGAIDWNSTGGQLYHTKFISNYAGAYGAALCRESNATGGHGANNEFISNTAGIAGAALGWINSVKITIINYTFIDNTASEFGGAIYVGEGSDNCSVIDCVFEGNNVTSVDGCGGAIGCVASNATVNNSNFTNNNAVHGGAIYIGGDSGNTNISGSRFVRNNAVEYGGAINIVASSVHINETYFAQNTAGIDGGAIYVGGGGMYNYIYNSNFEANNATNGNGGAIDWVASAGQIYYSNFTRNNAKYGGGIYFNGLSHYSSIYNVIFRENNATVNGGAIDWNAQNGKLYNTQFISNWAGEYGAALCRESKATNGSGENNTFIANHAGIAGAALAWMDANGIKINNYTFINNTADSSGGAIYVGPGSDNCGVANCTFSGNKVTNSTGGHGGAIDFGAVNGTVINSTFKSNEAFYGGAIFAGMNSGNMHIDLSNFTSNYATVEGGALHLRSDTAIVNHSRFTSNSVGKNGGAIYIGDAAKTNKIYYSVFDKNLAPNGFGGAVDWAGSAGDVFFSNFTNNRAYYGGGLYVDTLASGSKVSHAIFINNTATRNGGAIECNSSRMNLTHTQFISNTAEYGAALCREVGAVSGFGINNTFIKNNALISGAALGWMGVSNININNYTFTNNTAGVSGGAIYVGPGSDNCVVNNSTFNGNNVLTGRGGDIDWIGNQGSVIATTFKNSLAGVGGSIYVGEDSSYLNITDSSFTLARSLTDGGALELLGDHVSISATNFTSSLALNNGAAIHGMAVNNATISDCVFKYGVAAGYTDTSGESQGDGGAIYFEDSRYINITDTKFEGNEVRSNGASIAGINSSDSVLHNLSFYNDTAVNQGGSIYWTDSDNLTISLNKFNFVGSVYDGGAIYLSNVTANITDSVFNNTKAAWGYGGAIYVNGNVTINNVSMDIYVASNDVGAAIYFETGNSTLANSSLTGGDAIWINKTATVHLSKNNITGLNPTKNITYMERAYDSKYNPVDYAVWNDGELYLDKNNFDYVIFNNGTICTKTTTKMLNNGTYNVTWNETFVFFANITDDNHNTIISVRSLNTTNNIYTDPSHHYILPYNADGIRCIYQGVFHLTAIDDGLKQNTVFNGTLNVKMPVSMQVDIQQPTVGNIIITATLTPEVESNYTINNEKIFFKIGDKEFNVTIDNCPNNWAELIITKTLNNLTSGTHTLTATYNGDDVHLGANATDSANVLLRDSWIKVVIENINYAESTTAVITTNSNGTVRFNFHGKDRIIEVEMHRTPDGNYSGTVDITLENYTTTGIHDVGVVVEANEYFAANTNITSFEVYKLNTTVTATPISHIEVGQKQVIEVTVNENYNGRNPSGFVNITINGETYFKLLNESGMATFNIYELPQGDYTNYKVEYLGDGYFNGNSTTVTFNVGQTDDYNITVDVDNITYGQNATIYVSLPTSVTQNLTVYVNNTKIENVAVTNGLAKVVVPNLNAGNYIINVTYPGDNVYAAKDKNGTKLKVSSSSDWTLGLTVEAHQYGQNTIFTVNVPKNVATKLVNLTIDGVYHPVTINSDGVGTLSLNNLSGGFHTATANYTGDANYKTKANSTDFYIEPAPSQVNLSQEGRTVVAKVTENATGDVTFYVNGKNETKFVGADGFARWENVLEIGNNSVVVLYNGDRNFTISQNSTVFNVPKSVDGKVNVTATNETYGNASVITVRVPTSQTGYVNIVVNGTEINVTVPIGADGVARFNATGLDVGRYGVNVTYLGDKNYEIKENFTYFNITKANLAPVIVVQNATVKGNVSFVVDVRCDFKGRINITKDDVSYFDDDFKSLIILDKLPAGIYNVNMTFYGDGNYNNKTVPLTFEVSKVDPEIIVVINDITYPGSATANIQVNDHGNGTIRLVVDDKDITRQINNGALDIQIDGLSGGVKNATVTFTSSDNYYNDGEVKVRFEVIRASSQVNVTGDGKSVEARVTESATGTVTFYVNGENRTENIVGGIARWDDILDIGNNTVVVVYNGDRNFTISQNSTVINIPKSDDAKVNVTATNETYGNASVITVRVPTAQTGYVNIVVNGTGINVTVPICADGIARFNATGLDVGRYRVNVTYLGDKNYDVKENFTYFNITKANLDTTVYGLNVTVKDIPGFVVNVNDDFKGNVSIEIDGRSYYDGKVMPLISIGKLPAGEYIANVEFYGDDNYNDRLVDVPFTVSRVTPSINVTIDKVTYPGKAIAIINMSDYANGTINITVDGKVFNGTVSNGSASIDLEGLSAGGKVELVNFTATDRFHLNVTTTSSSIIDKAQSSVNITKDGNSVIARVTANAIGTVTFYVNGKVNTTQIDANGIARWDNVLEIGNNSVVAVYNGDENFTIAINSTSFNIPKSDDGKVNVTATNETYGNASLITVRVPTAQSGYVRITIDGTDINVTAEINEGVAAINVTGLDVGRYRVNVTYLGNDLYDAKDNYTYFNITEANLDATVYGLNVTVKDIPGFIVNANGDFKGNVSIEIDGRSYYDGKVRPLISIDDLLAGEYIANVEFYGDDNYNGLLVDVPFTVSRVTPSINVTIDKVTYPNKAVAVITMSDYANGTVNITVDGKVFNGTVSNGSASINLEGLSAGEKIELVNFTATDRFHLNVTTTSSSVIDKAQSSVNITQDGNSVIARVTADATGTVTFYVNGKVNTTQIDASGIARWDNVLEVGNNSVVAVYNGDENFTIAINSTGDFTVDKYTNATVNVTATNAVYGNYSQITVEVPKAQSGYVRIVVEGTDINVTAEINDGVATINVTGLDVARYRVNATYLGDENYDAVENHTYFSITKVDLSASVIVQNVTVAENASFVITANPDFNGYVNITRDGVSYYDGKLSPVIAIDKLPAGSYAVNVTFYGDNNYNDRTVKARFTVSAIKPEINVTIADATYPDNPTATVKVSGDANGTVEIIVGSETFSGEIKNGEVTIPLSGLDAGVKDALIKFISDDEYNLDANASYKFVINKTKSHIEINVTPESLYAGGDAIINITVSCTGEAYVYLDGVKSTELLQDNRIIIPKDDLAAGEHTIVVYYPGDNNYESSSESMTFTVDKHESHISIDVHDTPYDEIVEITVTALNKETGFVTITVNDENYTKMLEKGVAKFKISGLEVGKYTVNATYYGDGNYNNTTDSKAFDVTKIELDPTVIGLNITVAHNSTFIVVVPDDYQGHVNITVDGIKYSGDVSTIIKMARLKAGDKVANVAFYGDNNYKDTELDVSFTVSQNGELMVITEIVEDSTLIITLPENATGNVTVVLPDGSNTTANVTNGTAVVKIINQTPGVNNITVIYSGDENNPNVTVTTEVIIPKYDSEINVTVSEVKEGETATVTVKLPVDATGKVTVTIDGVEYSTDEINNGVATVTTEKLTAGDKTVVVEYSGDGNYSANYTVSDFTVKEGKKESEITVVDLGNGTVVVVIGDNATGNVTVKVGEHEYNATVKNGTAAVAIDKETPGIHEIEVVYSGDGNHTDAAVESIFTAPKYESDINVAVDDLGNGTVAVTVNVPEGASGDVTVYIGGKEYTREVTGTEVVIAVDGVSAGNHTVAVEYSGDDNFAGNCTISNVTVSGKVVSDPVVVDYGNGTVVVVVGDNATGNVTVKVGENTYNATVVNGTATITIVNETPGTHEIEVVYSGDGNHTNATVESVVTVPKYDSKVNVTVDDLGNGTVAVTVNVPEGASGDVTVYIGGKEYTREVTGTEVVIAVDGVSAGNHTVAVEYSGDDNFAGNCTISNVTVSGKVVSDPVVVDYGNGTVVVVVGDNATGNVTVKVGENTYNATVVNGTATITIDNQTPGTHEIEVIYSGDESHTNSTSEFVITAPKYESDINVTVSGLKEGETAIVKVEVPTDAGGNVTVYIDGENYTAEVKGGIATVEIENITGGSKTVTVEYTGDENYAGNYTIHTFEVEKEKETPSVIIEKGNNTVTVYIGDNATGNVTVKVGDNIYNATVVNGTATVTLTNVTPGKHDVEVIYSGDETHGNMTFNTTVVADKYETPISINVGDIDVGDKAIITVEVPEGAEGTVTIEINGKTYEKQIADGVARFEVEGLIAGEKSVFAVYGGDSNYMGNFTSAQFNVSKVDSKLSVEIRDIDVGENVTVTVHVPEDATGQVLIDIDGIGYYVNVTDGIGTVEIPYVGGGVHDVNLTYTGDDKYLPISNRTSVRVSKLESFVIPIACNIEVGENENIQLIVPADATGTVTVVIDGEEFDFNLQSGTLGATYMEGEKYTVAISGGRGELVISGLPKGEYVVSVRYNGDKKYLPSENSTIFTVSKQETPINVIESDNSTIKVSLPENATGYVTVTDGNDTYTAEIINGTVTIELYNATPGIHNVSIRFPGDHEYSSNTTHVIIEIPKYETPMSVDVHDIRVGETEVITVSLPDKATGIVTIETNGREYSADVSNGKAIFYINGLKFGDKTVSVKYSGDDNYLENYTTAQFTVSKVASTVRAASTNIVVGKDEVITVAVPADATGRVLVDIDGIGYYGNVVNGKAKVAIPDLSSGKYTAKVTYEGDDKYLPSSTTTSFTVSKAKAPISADANDIDEGEDATVIVKVPSDATGTITVNVDGKSYIREVEDGRAVFKIPGLKRGDYDIGASYSGDDKYEANDTITDIEVHFNETPEHHGEAKVKAGLTLSKYATGNPVLLLLLMVLAIGSTQIRRFKK